MQFCEIVAYSGPNLWSGVPSLAALVDLGDLQAWTSDAHPQVVSRLLTWLPGLNDVASTSPSEAAGGQNQESFGQAAERGMSLMRVLERIVCYLQGAAGRKPQFSDCVPTESAGREWLVVEYEEAALGRACLETARTCLLAALRDEPFDAPVEIRKLVDLADDVRLGPSTRAILRAAEKRGISRRRLTSGSLVQLGEGARQHRIWTAETDQTSSIGEDIAQDKDLTKLLLKQVGVPVPHGRVVYSADEACAVAREIGFPVVVKPRDANHGRGISFNLTTCEQIAEAIEPALRENKAGTSGVIVEQFARGDAHRLLVVGDRMIAAARGQNDVVVGNGRDSIRQLIEQANADPLRGENYTDPLGKIELNDVTLLSLKWQGFTPDSIPPAGQRILVRQNGDLTTDETEDVHPAVAERAVLAAQTVGLNIAGLDVIATDIGRPLEEQGGMIIEVNAGPGLAMHVEPLFGKPQPVGDAIVELMFPGGEDGRIPIVGIASGPGATEIGTIIAALLRRLGRRIGLATNGQVQVDGQQPYQLLGSDTDAISSLLLHPRVEAAVFECDLAAALARGLSCDRCDVVVLSNLSANGGDNASAQRWREVMPLVHAVPAEGAVIVADSVPELDRLLQKCRGQVVLYSTTGETARLREHQARDGRVAFFLADSLILASGPNAFFLPLKGLSQSEPIQREHLLPAVAAAWCTGLPVELLRDILARTGLNPP
jgi:cyanophycin synthetase